MTDEPTIYPISPFFGVTLKVATISNDGSDLGLYPDWVPVVGSKFTLTPSVSGTLVHTNPFTGEKIAVTIRPVEAVLNANGVLVSTLGLPVNIASGEDPNLSATGWVWRAVSQNFSPITFNGSPGTVVNLADYIQAPAVDQTKSWVEKIPELIEILGEKKKPTLWLPIRKERPQPQIAQSFSADRKTAFSGAHSFGRFYTSTDDGLTWDEIHQFNGSFQWAREMSNGELLVSVGENGSTLRSLWVSSGWKTGSPTWSKKLTAVSPNSYFASAWSVNIHENVVLAAEYGPKTPVWNGIPTTNPASRVWMSTDYGQTWTLVFNLIDYLINDRGLTNTNDQHLHGVAWDPYWSRIWVTFGDNTNGTVFSDDLGATWKTANWGPTFQSPWQAVGIVCLPDCILFGSDGPPNGVWRINRSQGKHSGLYAFEAAWTVPNDQGLLSHLCQAIVKISGLGGDTVIFGFGTETKVGKTMAVVTRNGWDFYLLWLDDLVLGAGRGIRTIAGPSSHGTLIIGSYDERGSNWSEWRGPLSSVLYDN